MVSVGGGSGGDPVIDGLFLRRCSWRVPSTGARPGHSRPARCAAGQWLDSRTSAIRHLDPPRLLESRPSYRLLGEQLDTGTLHCGPAASFDNLGVSEALGRELAITCLRR